VSYLVDLLKLLSFQKEGRYFVLSKNESYFTFLKREIEKNKSGFCTSNKERGFPQAFAKNWKIDGLCINAEECDSKWKKCYKYTISIGELKGLCSYKWRFKKR